jgi:predicted DNA-binding transcriptional regulator YafY
VRAYCHERNDYRDFILSRIDRTPQPVDTSAPSVVNDKQWNEVISITLVPNTQLTDNQKTLVEKDYGMPEGRLQLRVRQSLAHYTLQRYQAAITDEEIANSNQHHVQLIEPDRKNLYPHLFVRSS